MTLRVNRDSLHWKAGDYKNSHVEKMSLLRCSTHNLETPAQRFKK